MTDKNPGLDARSPRSILVVDDHPMTRYGIVRLIENEADLAVCGEAPDAPAALAAVKARKPELVLTDLTMPGREGLELIKDMRAQHPEVPALVMSMHEEEIYAERALRAGARGYVMKDAGAEQLLKAIRQVLSGRIYLSDSMSDRAAESLSGRCHRAGESTLVALTDREFEVFCLLGKGLSTRQIAQQLHLSQKTVETHRLHLREKLHLPAGPALLQYAVRWASTQPRG